MTLPASPVLLSLYTASRECFTQVHRHSGCAVHFHAPRMELGLTRRPDPSNRAPGCGNASRLSSTGAFARLLKLLRRYTEVADVAMRSPLEMGLPRNPLKSTMNSSASMFNCLHPTQTTVPWAAILQCSVQIRCNTTLRESSLCKECTCLKYLYH